MKALVAIALFLVEIAIARYAHGFVRSFVGDVLVVPLLWCALASVGRVRPIAVLLFAYAVELLQAIDYVALLGLEHHRIVSIILGRTFAWSDLAAYTVGYALLRGCLLTIEKNDRDVVDAAVAVRLIDE